MRAGKDRRNCIAYTSVEASVRIPRLIEGHQRSQILVGHGATKRASREIADDLAGTGCLVGRALGPADKYFLTAGGIAYACDVERPTDLQGMHSLYALLTTLWRNGANALVAFGKTAMQKGYRQFMLTGRGIKVNLPEAPI